MLLKSVSAALTLSSVGNLSEHSLSFGADMSTHPCCFCDLPQGDERHPWNQVLHADEKCFVVPTKGALVTGWVLVVPRWHTLSVGSLDREEQDGLASSVALVQQRVGVQFGEPTIFEHGPADFGSPLGCGVDHVHVHLAPLAFSLVEAVGAVTDVEDVLR